MTTPEVTISSVLREAADLIDRVGLYRGTGDEGDKNDPQCALTSINTIQYGEYDVRSFDAFGYLTKFLGFEQPHQVYQWNDRSKDGEVQRVMRLAADKYDEENKG